MEVVRKSKYYFQEIIISAANVYWLAYFSDFCETLPLVSDSIKKADFLAIDAEFTGLICGRDVSIFDLPEDYCTRLMSGSSEFLLIQFGLCAFYWDEKRKLYINDAYNFYLFPRGRPALDRTFLCQSSSMDFLAANGFDFNKLIKEGEHLS